jgi:hypothetical protein
MTPAHTFFGPFVHGLNKGGLTEIVRTSRLRGVAASNHMANDRPAVRAYVGSFDHQRRVKRWSGADKTFIEFYTHVPPRPQLPPGYAEWTEEGLTDGHLLIRISRILDGDGTLISPAHYGKR